MSEETRFKAAIGGDSEVLGIKVTNVRLWIFLLSLLFLGIGLWIETVLLYHFWGKLLAEIGLAFLVVSLAEMGSIFATYKESEKNQEIINKNTADLIAKGNESIKKDLNEKIQNLNNLLKLGFCEYYTTFTLDTFFEEAKECSLSLGENEKIIRIAVSYLPSTIDWESYIQDLICNYGYEVEIILPSNRKGYDWVPPVPYEGTNIIKDEETEEKLEEVDFKAPLEMRSEAMGRSKEFINQLHKSTITSLKELNKKLGSYSLRKRLILKTYDGYFNFPLFNIGKLWYVGFYFDGAIAEKSPFIRCHESDFSNYLFQHYMNMSKRESTKVRGLVNLSGGPLSFKQVALNKISDIEEIYGVARTVYHGHDIIPIEKLSEWLRGGAYFYILRDSQDNMVGNLDILLLNKNKKAVVEFISGEGFETGITEGDMWKKTDKFSDAIIYVESIVAVSEIDNESPIVLKAFIKRFYIIFNNLIKDGFSNKSLVYAISASREGKHLVKRFGFIGDEMVNREDTHILWNIQLGTLIVNLAEIFKNDTKLAEIVNSDFLNL